MILQRFGIDGNLFKPLVGAVQFFRALVAEIEAFLEIAFPVDFLRLIILRHHPIELGLLRSRGGFVIFGLGGVLGLRLGGFGLAFAGIIGIGIVVLGHLLFPFFHAFEKGISFQ